ncbi:4271_t:CDS:2, partial [Funneliformis geosporum]
MLMNKYQSTPIDFDEVLDDMKDENPNWFNLNVKIENLKVELKNQQKSMTVAEYNKKRVIFEYLIRLDDNRKGKMKAINHQAKCKKTIQLIDDEDIAEKVHIWIRSQ